MLKQVVALTCLTLSMGTNAAMVTSTYQITIGILQGTGDSAYLGHVYNVAITYDDAGTAMHRYDDSVNGIAESGGGDDTLAHTWDTTIYPGYTFMSDATFSFSNAPISSGLPVDEFYYNLQTVLGDERRTTYNLTSDSIDFYFVSDLYSKDYANLYLHTEDGIDGYRSSAVTHISTVPAVPIPAAAWLFGSALLGLGVVKRRKT